MTDAWTVMITQAEYIGSFARILVNATRPQDGVTVQRESSSPDRILQIEFPGACEEEPVSECYARGRDLVVAYKQFGTRSVRPHVYYRVLRDDSDITAVQLILSMQTSLLDSAPTTCVYTQAPQGECWVRNREAWVRGDGDSFDSALGFLVREPDGRSFFQLLHPSDHFESSYTQEGERQRLAFRVFPDSLEKGVIRRGRILAGWCSSDGDLDTVEQCFEAQAEESPPLTA